MGWLQRRLIIGMIALIIACLVLSISELRYVAWGRAADATLADIEQEKYPRRRSSPKIRVNYRFDDNGQSRFESDTVAFNWPVGSGPTVPIEYIPGGSSSRLKGHNDKAWLWASTAVLPITLILGGVWWKFRNVQ